MPSAQGGAVRKAYSPILPEPLRINKTVKVGKMDVRPALQ